MINTHVNPARTASPQKIILGIAIAAIALIVGFVIIFNGNKPTVYSISDGNFQISTAYGETIKISDIQDIQLKNELPSNLSRTNGYGFGTIVKGKCSSDDGDVTVYIDTSKPPFIYLTTASGLVILNDQSGDLTQTLYDNLNSAMKKS